MAIDSFNKEYGLFMSSDKDGTTSLPKRRRKRKEKVEEDSSETPTMKEVIEAEPEPKLDLKPRDNLPVEMQVRDIREIVGGVVPSEPSTTAPNLETAPTLTGSSVASTAESSTAGTSSASNDAFELLLEDARRMKADAGDVEIESDDSIKAKVRNVLSTIVTADFFIVFGFLLWFLAGIAYRAAFDDASVQIAFNSEYPSRAVRLFAMSKLTKLYCCLYRQL